MSRYRMKQFTLYRDIYIDVKTWVPKTALLLIALQPPKSLR